MADIPSNQALPPVTVSQVLTVERQVYLPNNFGNCFWPPTPPFNSPFFSLLRHTSDETPRKGSFLTSTIAHLVDLTISCIVVCMVAPHIYFPLKLKKLLVIAMTSQRFTCLRSNVSFFEISKTTGKISMPLWDKVKLRALTAHKHVKYNIMVKQGNTWYAPGNKGRNLSPIQHEGV